MHALVRITTVLIDTLHVDCEGLYVIIIYHISYIIYPVDPEARQRILPLMAPAGGSSVSASSYVGAIRSYHTQNTKAHVRGEGHTTDGLVKAGMAIAHQHSAQGGC
jgi:hypothetical protein